jgi:hypothetical protein
MLARTQQSAFTHTHTHTHTQETRIFIFGDFFSFFGYYYCCPVLARAQLPQIFALGLAFEVISTQITLNFRRGAATTLVCRFRFKVPDLRSGYFSFQWQYLFRLTIFRCSRNVCALFHSMYGAIPIYIVAYRSDLRGISHPRRAKCGWKCGGVSDGRGIHPQRANGRRYWILPEFKLVTVQVGEGRWLGAGAA